MKIITNVLLTSFICISLSFSVFAGYTRGLSKRLVLSEKGVGPITKSTPFDVEKIQKLLPSYSVEKDAMMSEGESYPIIRVLKGKQEILVITPEADFKRIMSVMIKADKLRSPFKGKIGASYQSVYKGTKAFRCYPGVEEMSGTVSCAAPSFQNIRYFFAGEWNGPDGKIPPLNVLKDWKIKFIVWTPLM